MTRNAGKRESRALPRLAGLGAPLYIISGHLLIHTHPPAHAPTVGKQPMGGAPDTVILLSMKRSMRVCACSREHPRGRRQPPSSRHPREPGPPASCPVAGPRTGRRRAIVPRPRVCVRPSRGRKARKQAPGGTARALAPSRPPRFQLCSPPAGRAARSRPCTRIEPLRHGNEA